jgi:hypothetical protein
MARFNKKQHDRMFYDACAGDDVMSVYRLLPPEDWKRDNLVEAHIRLVYDFALAENEYIDYAVKNASWLKPRGVAARIIERQKAAL